MTGIIAFICAMPAGVYATTAPVTVPAGGYDITVEYRYTEGEEGNVNIPATIERYGRMFKLIDKRPAVLENTLPATRTYSWSVDGFMTEAQAEQLKIDFPGIALTPAVREGEESVDITRTVENLPANDVELIPYSIDYNNSEMRRAAVQFEIAKDSNGNPAYDAFGLPESYTAEVIYRGLGSVIVPGYYSASQTYESQESLGDVSQYVIITTYSPVAQQTVSSGTSASSGGGIDASTPAELADPVPIGSLVPDSDTDDSSSSATIEDDPTPQTNPKRESNAQMILLTILKVILIIIAAFVGFIGALILRKKVRRARRLRRRAA